MTPLTEEELRKLRNKRYPSVRKREIRKKKLKGIEKSKGINKREKSKKNKEVGDGRDARGQGESTK